MDNKIQIIVNDTVLNIDFRSKNIPSIDLYMDQIIGLINGSFAMEGNGQKENQLTKTMIHNYSKEGLIKPIKGKKYTKEHILQMLMVYQLKNTLKISDIKDTLTSLYQEENYDEAFLVDCFDAHMERREVMQEDLEKYIADVLCEKNFDAETDKDLFVLLLNLAMMSSYLKCLAEGVSHIIAESKDGKEKK